MDRLTCKYDEQNALRELCSFGRKSDIEADDCLKCDEYCDMVVKECTYADYPCDKCAIQTAFDKLAEYEDLDEKGLIFKSPYKIGDVIYLCISKRIIELKISCIEFRHDRKPFYRTYKVNTGEVGNSFGVDDIGKTVFLTKEAAEQELERIMSKKV